MKFVSVMMIAVALSGCGIMQHNREVAERRAQMNADAARCRGGDEQACKVYQIEVQRCAVPIAAESICQEW